jgi:hypothetical protein
MMNQKCWRLGTSSGMGSRYLPVNSFKANKKLILDSELLLYYSSDPKDGHYYDSTSHHVLPATNCFGDDGRRDQRLSSHKIESNVATVLRQSFG